MSESDDGSDQRRKSVLDDSLIKAIWLDSLQCTVPFDCITDLIDENQGPFSSKSVINFNQLVPIILPYGIDSGSTIEF
jgi:hypothetical protein